MSLPLARSLETDRRHVGLARWFAHEADGRKLYKPSCMERKELTGGPNSFGGTVKAAETSQFQV